MHDVAIASLFLVVGIVIGAYIGVRVAWSDRGLNWLHGALLAMQAKLDARRKAAGS